MKLNNKIDWNQWTLDRLYAGYYNILNQNFGNGFNTSVDDLRRKVSTHFFSNLPGIGFITHEENLFKGHVNYNCWRMRRYGSNINSQFENILPTSIFECSYPPLENCTIGRCNFPQEQIFYGGEHPIQVAHEMDFRPGDRFLLSSWELKMQPYQVFIFYTAGVQHISFINKMVNKFFEELKVHIPEEHYILYKHWMNITTSLLLSHNRMVSAWISHELLRKGNTILTYPSLKYFGLSNNMAIPRKIADSENFKINRVLYCEVEKWQYHQRIGKVLMEGVIDHTSGIISWSKVDGFPYLFDPDSMRIYQGPTSTLKPL